MLLPLVGSYMGNRDKLPFPKDDVPDIKNAVAVVEYGPLVYAVGSESDAEWLRFHGNTEFIGDMA